MSEVYRPYSEGINNTVSAINQNTGTFTARVPIGTISSGLEQPAVFSFDICVGAINMFPNKYALEGRGYMYSVPRIIPANLESVLSEFWIDGKVERLKRIKETESEGEYLYEYVMTHKPVKNIKIFRHHRKDDELNSWYEVIYADGTLDIFNAEGEIERRISPSGHNLIFTTCAVNKYESLLIKVEDEYGHGKIEVTYGDQSEETQVINIVESLGEDRKKLTKITFERKTDANIKLVNKIEIYENPRATESEKVIEFIYEKYADGNYYIKQFYEGYEKVVELSYGTMKYDGDKDIYVITEAKTSTYGYLGYTINRYIYSRNTYTGFNGIGWRKKEYYDSCMYMPDDNYRYEVSEHYLLQDSNYPKESNVIFCTKRIFNKYHLLVQETTGFADEENEWKKKIKTEEFTYGNLLVGNGENIENQPGNYSDWTMKRTIFHKDNCTDIIEVEQKESLENGLPSKIIDKNGVEKTMKYYEDPQLLSGTKVKTLISEVVNRTIDISEPLDFYNKSIINYIKIGGRIYRDTTRGIVIQQFLYLPSVVTLYKDKNDRGLITEKNEYYAVNSSVPRDFFFFGYKTRTVKQGDLTLGNCLYENTTYSYFDNIRKLLLVRSYKSNKANKDAPEKKSLIKYFVINPVTGLCIKEWYQLSLENNIEHDLSQSTYDNFGRLLTKSDNRGRESYSYSKDIKWDTYDPTDLFSYRVYEYTDIYGFTQIILTTAEGKVVKIYGRLPGSTTVNILEKNRYIADKYLKENIIYDYSASNVEKIANKTTHDYVEYRLTKTTFPDGTFENYENDEYLKRKTIQKNHYLKNVIEFDSFENITKKNILKGTSEHSLITQTYDEYNRLIKIKKYDNYEEEYSYDKFNRLVEKKVNPTAPGGYFYKEDITYPETALNSDKAKKREFALREVSYSTEYSIYGEIISENDNTYEYDPLRENQLTKISNGVGEVNYTYYSNNDLPERINFIQKKAEEPFETNYYRIEYGIEDKLCSYRVKNMESNALKNCAQVNYTYTTIGGEKSVELKIGENENNLQRAALITKSYTAYENVLLSTNYSHVNCQVANTYDKVSGNLTNVEYSFGESTNSITFELTYNNETKTPNYNFGQLETIIMTAPNFSINNTLKFTYDEQGRESKRSYYKTSNVDEILLNVDMVYTIDSKITSTKVSCIEETIQRTNYYNAKSGKLSESRKSFVNLGYDEREVITAESPELISKVETTKGTTEIMDLYINENDSIGRYEHRVNGEIPEIIDIGKDSCGNYINDFDNSKIIYNAANKVINLQKKETLEKYNYYYYMTGELMCVSEIKENPRKIYYLYNKGKNIGELIYEGTTLKTATLYLDINGFRVGRYIKDYGQNKESIELFFNESSGTVHRVSLYEKNHGATTTERPNYTVYGEMEIPRYDVSQHLGEHKHVGLKTSAGHVEKFNGLFTNISKI